MRRDQGTFCGFARDNDRKRVKVSRFEGFKKKILPIFEPSGLLELESNSRDGVQLKHVEPDDAVVLDEFWKKHHVELKDQYIEKLIIYRKGSKDAAAEYDLSEKSSFTVGRDMKTDANEEGDDDDEVVVADIGVREETCSKQHCVIQHRLVSGIVKCYVMDLESSNGTVLNGIPLPSARYIELKSGDVITLSEHDEDVDYELVYVRS
ncbi:hypothetical protein TPHA_0N00930 [Tetrapisispora phaffii CBS 4417]|uniref:FHA domain-containing protein n=1 Tax=Tetrapisispora phaffii (strain ATCC 24235 / CBS 4417 / NBRC 1672 / NRRL Y-8282 / UCD 70-5) TaxID=1071381 RepID=G8C146_TETPH|nr:hypothetical protein TPHA_0N00930 [Tetrapisispora phaffii CBS 4417]CCE65874.1 hypothetical protein TPHA_0N00930 [Tetrapisispora phaffii CBS 4417]